MLSSAFFSVIGLLPTLLPINKVRHDRRSEVKGRRTVHLLPCLQEVLRICECHEAVLSLYNREILVKAREDACPYSHLLTSPVADDSSLRERRIRLESVGKNVIRDIITQVTNEKTEPC